MNVGILGTGVVGDALAAGFSSRGHDVRQGSRDQFAEIAEASELVVLATKGEATEQVAAALAGQLAGKVVVDATNPMLFRDDARPTLFVGHDDSLGERVQRAAPEARVVKCFNTVSSGEMVDPRFETGAATMFYAGEDAEAKATVAQILASFGWESTWDVGGIEASRMLESLCELWVAVGVRRGAWDHAFALLTT